MKIIYFKKHKTEVLHENVNYSGFVCPYSKENCVHIDSLSMTRTVNCNVCGTNTGNSQTENGVSISFFNNLILN